MAVKDPASSCTSFVALFDIHYGFENNGRRREPVHSERALSGVGQFLEDFSPDVLIYGGDALDCRMISHHTRGKHREMEGLRLAEDAKGFAKEVLLPFDRAANPRKRVYITGNHEDWLEDVVEDYPGLEGLLDLPNLLPLDAYDVVGLGEPYRIGKLHFLHGEAIKGGVNHARWAISAYERSVRYGHFHTFQAATKTSALDVTDVRTAMAIPCLCTLGPSYGQKAPNAWLNGFLYGWVAPDGTFSDVPVIIPPKGRFTANGKTYQP